MARRNTSFFDLDEAEKDEYAGKLADKGDEGLVTVAPGKLRSGLLSGSRYAVRKVDMKKPLFDQDSMSDQSDEEDDDDDDEEEEDEEEDSYDNHRFIDNEPEETDDSEEDKDVNRMKRQLKKTSQFTKGDDDSDDLGSGLGDDLSEMEDEDKWGEEEDDDDDDDDGMGDYSNEEEQDKVLIMKDPGDDDKKAEKGLALMKQLQTWDSLMELRINSQKLSNHANQLPLPTSWQQFQAAGGVEWTKASREVTKRLKNLLDSLLSLQTSLSQQFPSTQHLAIDGQEGSSTKTEPAPGADDEEIPSDNDNEELPASPTKETASPSRPLKRKLSMEEYEPILAKSHKKFCAYRNQVIQVWDDQTSFEQGSLKKFQSFHVPVIEQIEQIMADRDRLLKRSQLLRTNQRILGTLDEEVTKAIDREPNVYDENDLYQKMLYEVINRKCADDPILRSRQWVAIQSMRSKLKRRVDTKASKGRKLRYNVVEKLINFMARRDRSGPQWTDEAMDNLFSSVGGSRAERKQDEEDGDEHGGVNSSETPTKADGGMNGTHREEGEELSDGEEDVDDDEDDEEEEYDDEEEKEDEEEEEKKSSYKNHARTEVNIDQKDLLGFDDDGDDDDDDDEDEDEDEEDAAADGVVVVDEDDDEEEEEVDDEDDDEEEEDDEEDDDGVDTDQSDES